VPNIVRKSNSIRNYWSRATGRNPAEASAAGKARMEGRDYVMREGDVVEFGFNV
jgi:ribosome-binding ATPase